MIRINLLPVKALQAEVTLRREIVIGAVVLGAVLALLIGTHIYQTLELSGLQSELASLRADLQALNVKIKEVGDLQNKIKDLRSKNKIIENLNKKKAARCWSWKIFQARHPIVFGSPISEKAAAMSR